MSKVFIVQNQKRRDPMTREYVAKFDVSPALQYGTLVELLDNNASPFYPERVHVDLRERLVDFSDDDYILCIGNPILIAMAFAVAADFNEGRVKVLQWSTQERRYICVPVSILESSIPDN